MRDLQKNPVRTLFLGSSWESVETLKYLDNDQRFNIVGVITTTDKPTGREQILRSTDVKKYAVENNIKVFHTEKKEKKYKEALDIFQPELIVCKAFGEIVPEFFIDYPKYKSINIHFSILPKYRGAVPIQKAILNGEEDTGITVMLMSKNLDEGDILKTHKEEILPNDTNLSLRKKLVNKTAKILGNTLEEWINGKIKPKKQNNDKATYCWQKDISKENAQIDWKSMEPEYIERMVRAFIPWPIAWTEWNGKRLKIFNAELKECKNSKDAGNLFIDNNDLLFSTKEKDICLKINELQLEGKQKMSLREFINGFQNQL